MQSTEGVEEGCNEQRGERRDAIRVRDNEDEDAIRIFRGHDGHALRLIQYGGPFIASIDVKYCSTDRVIAVIKGYGSYSYCMPVQYSTVQYSTVQYSTVQYSTVQYSTVQYSRNQD